MKRINVVIVFAIILLGTSIAFAQGSIYSICDPEGKYLNTKEEWLPLEAIIGNTIKDITVIEFHGGWKDKEEAKRQLMNKLQDIKIKASSLPRWSMDLPVELVGIIKYQDGFQGKIAVNQHRVGFQDKTGKPWYFQWEERIPWRK